MDRWDEPERRTMEIRTRRAACRCPGVSTGSAGPLGVSLPRAAQRMAGGDSGDGHLVFWPPAPRGRRINLPPHQLGRPTALRLKFLHIEATILLSQKKMKKKL